MKLVIFQVINRKVNLNLFRKYYTPEGVGGANGGTKKLHPLKWSAFLYLKKRFLPHLVRSVVEEGHSSLPLLSGVAVTPKKVIYLRNWQIIFAIS